MRMIKWKDWCTSLPSEEKEGKALLPVPLAVRVSASVLRHSPRCPSAPMSATSQPHTQDNTQALVGIQACNLWHVTVES